MRAFSIYFFVMIFCCVAVNARAQTTYSIRGVIYSKGAAGRVANVAITNTHNKTIFYSNDIGLFNITAAVGDTLEFIKDNFTTARQIVFGPADMAIFMLPVTQLNEVSIKGQTKKQQLDEVVNIYRSKGLYFDGRPPLHVFSPISGSPITGFYELFGRDAKNIRRFIKYSKQEQAAAQDQAKYNKEIVKKITRLPDEEIQKFMDTYTPPHEDLLKWNDYEVIDYIKKSLEKYRKYGAQPLQKLY